MTLYIKESGTIGAPTILFLHGAGQDHHMWQLQVAELQDYHCLAVDLPGQGQSNQEKWVSLGETAVLLADLIRDRATDGKAHLVGLSLGGYLVTLLLAQAPERVDHAIISGISIRPLSNKLLIKLLTVPLSYFAKSDLLIRSTARQLHVPDIYQKDFGNAIKKMDRHAYVSISNEAFDFQLPAAVRQISRPTLAVAGELEIKQVVQSVYDLVHLLPQAQGYLAPGVKHGWNVEIPDVFTAMIRAWIEETPLPDVLIPVPELSSPSPL